MLNKDLLQMLKENPHLLLFLNTHLEIRLVESYRPHVIKGKLVFPRHYKFIIKHPSLLEKLKYYIKDFILYWRMKYGKRQSV